jgi:hypothetical protein
MAPGALLPLLVTVPELVEPCDRCGAPAKLAVTLRSGGELAFCGHHANRYGGPLVPRAAHVSAEDGFAWHPYPHRTARP